MEQDLSRKGSVSQKVRQAESKTGQEHHWKDEILCG